MPKKGSSTRTESDQPAAVSHLTTEQQTALEIAGEAEHADGRSKEKLTQKSKKLADPEKST